MFVDWLTKMTDLIPCTKEVTATQYARLFVDNLIRLHGIPEVTISDRDPRCVSKFWTELFSILGDGPLVQYCFSSSNGRVVRGHHLGIRESLVAVCGASSIHLSWSSTPDWICGRQCSECHYRVLSILFNLGQPPYYPKHAIYGGTTQGFQPSGRWGIGEDEYGTEGP